MSSLVVGDTESLENSGSLVGAANFAGYPV
jgi:hypothetical protein